MIRKATKDDIAPIVKIYDAILAEEEAGNLSVGWIRGVYPTEETARTSLALGTLFVCEDEGKIVAAAKIDQTQIAEYANCEWQYDAEPEEVMVLHTLVVDPACGKRGYGKAFVEFYEQYALRQNCRYLRMDTNARNLRARKMYKNLGYREAGIVPSVFNGIPDVQLVCLEKRL